MKRAEFLEKLMQALAFMTAEERRSVREYYEELLDDALEAGEAEEAVLAGFGAPEEIAQRIKAEYVPQELTGAATGGTTAAQQETKLVCVHSETATVRLAGCRFARLLELGSQNGAIQVQESGPADCIRLLNKNGSITAEILDKEEAYSIDTHTANGRCTLPTCLRPNAGKTLYAHTVNGRVTIAFCG